MAEAAEEPAAVADSIDPPVADDAAAEASDLADVLPEPDAVSDAAEEAVIDDVPLTMHTHEVKAGEDLYSVSLIWDVSIEELKRVNGLSGTDLTTGQILRIPRPQ